MISKIFNKSTIYKDLTLNILAAGIVAVVLQLIIYPSFSRNTSPELFGEILVMMSVVNIIAVLLGNSLNNIRLISNKDYKEEGVSGDFLILLFFASIVNITLMTIVINLIWSEIPAIEKLYLVVISLITMIKAYLIVGYRLDLNFILLFKQSITYIVSLIIGVFIFSIYTQWQIVFVIGELGSLVFIIKTTNLIKEPIKITKKFRKTLKQYFFLSVSSAISNLLVYMDRIIISGFLGVQQVAVFFAATVIGKMSGFILAPISSVILSYISSKNRKVKIKEFIYINIFLIIFSLIMALFTYYTSLYFIRFLYPDLYIYTVDILLVANLAAILISCSNIPQAIVLRYNSTHVQIYIQVFYGAFYVLGGIYLIINYGLEGFGIAILIAAILKFILLFIIGIVSLRKENNF